MLLTIAKRDNSLLDKGKAITELQIFNDLFNIAIPVFSLEYNISKYDVYNYKVCKSNKSTFLLTKNGDAGKDLKKRMNENYTDCLSEMKCFIEKYIDVKREKDKWLVYALLELIEIDATIASEQPFYIQDNTHPVPKKDLTTLDKVNLPAFLLGIFLFVLTEIEDNKVGKETYEEWCPAGEKHRRRKFNSTIGQNPKHTLLIECIIPENSEDSPSDGDKAESTADTMQIQRAPIYDTTLRSANDALDYENANSLQIFLSQGHYQLIMTNQEIHGAKHVDVPLECVLYCGGASSEIKERCADLSEERIAELLTYPAIICNENNFQNGKTDENQLAILAQLKTIKKRENAVRLGFQPLAAFLQTGLNEYAADFGFSSDGTLATLNTPHWVVCEKNLFREFQDAGIPFCRYTLLYQSSILKSDIPADQTELLVTDLEKLHIGSYKTINPYLSVPHLENEQVYRHTAVFQFKNVYVHGKRFIRLSTSWNGISISGDLSPENWTSKSYMNNFANAGSGKITAIFKVIRYESNSVQFLLLMEVKDE